MALTKHHTMKIKKLVAVITGLFLSVLISCNLNDCKYNTDGMHYKIPKLADIEIDGDASDWESNGFAVQMFANKFGETISENDLDANFKLGWDETGLLLMLEVKDDTIFESNHDQALWQGDGIEFFLA